MCQAASCSGCAGWGVPGGFVLMLAGECPLFSAWGRFEDGAPARHEHLHRGGVPTPGMGRPPRLEPPLRMSTYALNDEL